MVKSISDRRLGGLKNGNALREYVIDYIKENSQPEERANFFEDLMWHGCISGMIGPLIYYKDTAAFFDRFYAEIEDLRQCYEVNSMPFQIKGDLKNFLAWFGFEETTRQLADELELDV